MKSNTYAKLAAGLRIRFAFFWCALAVSLLALGAARVEAQNSWGLKAKNNQFWQQGRNGLGGSATTFLEVDDQQGVNHFERQGDRFGQAVASGDFNRDGFADVAIGAPDEDARLFDGVGIQHGRGGVTIIYGTGHGLDFPGSHFLKQGEDGIPGTSKIGDQFGAALATGDFNGDGYADLAIGIPGENGDGPLGEGAVSIIYGGPDGLRSTYGPPNQTRLWRQDSCDASQIPGAKCLEGQSEAGDGFGATLVTGDFDGDGVDDLAVGVPGENTSSGAVAIIYGSHTNGLGALNGPQGNQLLTQNYCDPAALGGVCIEGGSEDLDNFGLSLVAADFTGDGVDDLAIGAPGENDKAGAVNVIYGKAGAGLLAANGTFGSSIFQQGRCRIATIPNSCLKGNPEGTDLFGSALAGGDFNRDGAYDLAIGAPGEDTATGVVHVIYGGSQGLKADNTIVNQIFSQDTAGAAGDGQRKERYGATLAAGDFRGNGFHDLVIGVPDENRRLSVYDEGAGAVNVIYGGGGGLNLGNAPGNQIWTQDSDGILEEEGEYYEDVTYTGTADQFGSALATGDFNGDGVSDLIIGVPGEGDSTFFDKGDAGGVNVLYGNPHDSSPPLVEAGIVGDTVTGGEWYTSPARVIWDIDDPESAVVGGSLTTTPCPFVLVGETGPEGRQVICTARSEGGTTTEKVTVHVDTHAPNVSVPITPAPNALGWNNTNVGVAVSCTDFPGGSGLTRCSEGRTFTASGSFIAEGADVAGNVTRRPVSINIDKIDPTIASVAFSTPLIFQNTNVTATPNASDALSGIASKSCEKPNTTTLGTRSLTCTAVDKAGNGTQRSFSYTVLSFFLVSGVNTGSSINGVAIASWGSGGLGVGSLNSVSVVARGEGTATVAGFTSNPGSRAGFTTSNAFSFVNFEYGHSFGEATITNCRLGGGSLAYWRNGGAWQLVSDQTYDRSRSCLTMRLTDTSSPSIRDLTGGAFFGIKNTEDQILDLMTLVDSINLKKSSDKKLNHDLDKALAAVRKGDTNGVCKELERFIKQVNQEARKKVTSEEATQLLTAVNMIKTLSACP